MVKDLVKCFQAVECLCDLINKETTQEKKRKWEKLYIDNVGSIEALSDERLKLVCTVQF